MWEILTVPAWLAVLLATTGSIQPSGYTPPSSLGYSLLVTGDTAVPFDLNSPTFIDPTFPFETQQTVYISSGTNVASDIIVSFEQLTTSAQISTVVAGLSPDDQEPELVAISSVPQDYPTTSTPNVPAIPGGVFAAASGESSPTPLSSHSGNSGRVVFASRSWLPLISSSRFLSYLRKVPLGFTLLGQKEACHSEKHLFCLDHAAPGFAGAVVVSE